MAGRQLPDDFAFFITRVGEPGSGERRRADDIQESILAPVLTTRHIKLIRGDEDLTPGHIPTRIIKRILRARVVIADLTGHSPNAFYELGIAHAFTKPVILLIDAVENIPFDIQGQLHIILGDPKLGDDVAELRNSFAKALEELLKPDFEPTSSVTAATRGSDHVRAARFAREVAGLWIQDKSIEDTVEGEYAIVEFAVRNGAVRVRGRSYGFNGRENVEWGRDLSYCWVPPQARVIYHTFDADIRGTQAMGVTRYNFDDDLRSGDGYYVVHGSSTIKLGRTEFSLRRVTPDLLGHLALPAEDIAFDDHEACRRLIAALLHATGQTD